MNKKFMILYAVLFYFSSLNAQLASVFNFPDYLPQAYTTPKQFTQVELDGIMNLPQEGENITWDFSDYTAVNSTFIHYYPVRDTFFMGSNILITGNSEYIKGTFIPYDLYVRFYASGNAWVGRHYPRFAMGLGFVSGNISDSLIIPDQASAYTPNLFSQRFPQAYGDGYTSSTITLMQGEVTFSMAGYNHAPFVKKTKITREENITGWGQSIIPLPSGGVAPFACLLQKSKITTVDSFFVNGQAAPSQLLAAFGMQQGGTDVQSFSYLYALGRYIPLITYVHGSGSFEGTSKILLSYDELGYAAIHENEEKNITTVYPNPCSGNLLYFKTAKKVNFIDVLDATGKIVSVQKNITTNWIQIPENWTNGSYYLRFVYDGGNTTIPYLINR